MIKGVIFDFHGVMTDEKEEVLGQRVLDLFNFKYADLPDELKVEFKKLGHGQVDAKKLWSKAKQKYNLGLKGNMFKLYWIYKYFSMVEFYDGMYKLVKELEKKGYKICLLSNTYKPFYMYVRLLGKYRVFKNRVVSCNVGLAKPDRRIFELALKKIGLKADDVVLVDDKKRNTDAAEAIGIKGIVFKDEAQLRKDLISLGLNL